MQDFLENAKRAAGNAIERAAWEADKMRRSTTRQREAELMQRERSALLEQLAGVVLDLDQRGQLTQPPLRALAERLRTLDDDINHAMTDARAIRDEPYAPGSISIGVQRRDGEDDTVMCPTCRQPVRKGAAFCSSCGARL